MRKAKRAKKVESSVNEFKIAENSQRKKEQVHPAVMRKGSRKLRRRYVGRVSQK